MRTIERIRRMRPLLGALLGILLSPAGTGSLSAADAVVLRYTYREETGKAAVLRDLQGREYVSLVDTAGFYGIRISFAPSTGRVTLSKGERQVHFALDQDFFLLGDTRETCPMDPAVLVDGQPGVDPDSLRDVLGFILNLNVQYLADERILVAGGVDPVQVRREIMASISTPVAAPAKGHAVPTPTPDKLASIPAVTPRPTKRVERVKITPPSRDKVYRVRKVVIDAGHGGRDGGARGASGRYHEKQATLDIAKRVAEILADEPGLEVLLTRKKDIYLSLKQRTEFANKHEADLFVSIHANANRNRKAAGTETYVYSSRASAKVASIAAHRENADVNLMDFTMNDLLHSAYRQRSFLLAEKIDQRIRDRLGQRIRRIEQAPFYVLARVKMPSVLIESAFISNKSEERKLRDPKWRARLAKAIADGILAYRNQAEKSLEAMRAGSKGR